jgi:hypothetical protein
MILGSGLVSKPSRQVSSCQSLLDREEVANAVVTLACL